MIKSYKELIIWQKSMTLVEHVYKATSTFPPEERFGLSAQMRRCAISIPSNIAEGKSRKTRKDFAHFMQIAYASGAELETQLELSSRLSLLNNKYYIKINELLTEIMKMLNVITNKLKASASKT